MGSICRQMEAAFVHTESGVTGIEAIGRYLREHSPLKLPGENELPDRPVVEVARLPGKQFSCGFNSW